MGGWKELKGSYLIMPCKTIYMKDLMESEKQFK